MDIYSQELLEIYRNPMNRGKILSDSVVKVTENNPFCGDSLDLYLLIENNVVKSAKFDGEACAVSTIASALFTDDIIGKKLEDVKKIDKNYLLNLVGINLTTSRVKCATLVLNALHSALEKYEQTKSTK